MTPEPPATPGDATGGRTPAPAPSGVRMARRDEVDRLCRMLAETFDDDPVTNFIFPDDRRRAKGLQVFFRLQMTRGQLPFGGVYTNEDGSGAAIWAPPGRPMPTGLAAIGQVLPVAPYVWPTLRTTLAFLTAMEKTHPHEPHWYLATLGTHPTAQGRGVGSSLLAPVLARADAEGMPAYLESSKERNVPFYRRHGFEVVGELTAAGSPTLWRMWREPVPPG